MVWQLFLRALRHCQYTNSIIKFLPRFITWFQLWRVLYRSALIDIIHIFTGWFPDNVAILRLPTTSKVILRAWYNSPSVPFRHTFAHVHVCTVRLYHYVMCAILAARKQWLLLSIWCYRGGRCIRITWFATPLTINTCQMCFFIGIPFRGCMFQSIAWSYSVTFSLFRWIPG